MTARWGGGGGQEEEEVEKVVEVVVVVVEHLEDLPHVLPGLVVTWVVEVEGDAAAAAAARALGAAVHAGAPEAGGLVEVVLPGAVAAVDVKGGHAAVTALFDESQGPSVRILGRHLAPKAHAMKAQAHAQRDA